MTSREIFVLALRIIGVWELTRAIDYFVEAFDISTKLYKTTLISIGSAYAHTFVYLAVGLYLLAGAPHVVKKIYGGGSDHADQHDGPPKI